MVAGHLRPLPGSLLGSLQSALIAACYRRTHSPAAFRGLRQAPLRGGLLELKLTCSAPLAGVFCFLLNLEVT